MDQHLKFRIGFVYQLLLVIIASCALIIVIINFTDLQTNLNFSNDMNSQNNTINIIDNKKEKRLKKVYKKNKNARLLNKKRSVIPFKKKIANKSKDNYVEKKSIDKTEKDNSKRSISENEKIIDKKKSMDEIITELVDVSIQD